MFSSNKLFGSHILLIDKIWLKWPGGLLRRDIADIYRYLETIATYLTLA